MPADLSAVQDHEPAAAIGNAGIGVQLADSEVSREIRRKIEGALAGASNSSRMTHTL